MPTLAEQYGVLDLLGPAQNFAGRCRYLTNLLTLFNGNPELALAAYYAGEATVITNDGVPPVPETDHIVERVLAL